MVQRTLVVKGAILTNYYLKSKVSITLLLSATVRSTHYNSSTNPELLENIEVATMKNTGGAPQLLLSCESEGSIMLLCQLHSTRTQQCE